jgi:methylenetetrahydrofolate dehydrogenase (NADP+)/methenyltetrahydrofolate cyclohydrolase
MEFFNGKEVRDEILLGLRKKVVEGNLKKTLAVILAGDDKVCEKYVELKKKTAEKLDIDFLIYKFDQNSREEEIIECINFLNADDEVDGIMIQIPVDKKFNRDNLIKTIAPEKDVDGLRFCLGIESDFKPPVVLSILEAVKRSSREIKAGKVVVVGKGFLVGAPLVRLLEEFGVKPVAITKSKSAANAVTGSRNEFGMTAEDLKDIEEANILISAVGKANIIKKDMVKEGVVLIDAGTTEQSGTLVGDIDPDAYEIADYYTPVPGGIGPVTVAMLFSNLIK